MAITKAPHMVAEPRWLLIFRILQFVLAVAMLGIAGFLTSVFPLSGFAMALVTAIFTLIIVAYNLIATKRNPGVYNCWAILGLEILAHLFWLSTLSTLASYAAIFGTSYSSKPSNFNRVNPYSGNSGSSPYVPSPYVPSPYVPSPTNTPPPSSCTSSDSSTCFRQKRDLGSMGLGLGMGTNYLSLGVGFFGAATGIAVFEFVFFSVTLVTYSVHLRRHRISDGSASRLRSAWYSMDPKDGPSSEMAPA